MQNANRTRAALWLVPALLLVLCAGPAELVAQETQDTMKLAAPLRAARAALSGGYAALDPGRVSVLFADSAVVQFRDQMYSGKQAVDGWIADSMMGLTQVRFGTSSFTISETEVVDWNTYMVTLGDGTQVEGTSEATWRKQADGSWKVIRLVVT